MTQAAGSRWAEQAFLDNLGFIEAVARRSAAKKALPPAEIDDFVGEVRLKLILDDYAVLRGYEGRRESSLKTFLVVVINHALLDLLDRLWGKRRPSKLAEELGPAAVEYERLRVHDRLSGREALTTLASRQLSLEPHAVYALEARISQRSYRSQADEAELADLPAPNGRGDEHLLTQMRAQLRRRALAETGRLRAELPPEDQAILCCLFDHSWSVAETARRCHLDQKQLYRRRDRLLGQLKEQLLGVGWTTEDVAEALAGDDLEEAT